MPELKRATEDIASALSRFEVRRATRLRFKRQLAATDGVLDLLEGMNLQERDCVGAVGARQIRRTLEALPPSLRLAVGPKTRVQRALDMVFDTQAVLLSWHSQGQRTVPIDEPALTA
jgi:hypothetical protein